MSNTNSPKPQKNKPAARKDDGLTAQQRHANWKENKVAKAAQDDFNVISQKTRDSAELVNLLNFNDQLMYQLRMSAGLKGSRINLDTFQKFMDRSEEAKELLNTINAELCQALGRDYVPPRGFKHPLKKQQQAAPAKKKGTVTKLPVADQEKPVREANEKESTIAQGADATVIPELSTAIASA